MRRALDTSIGRTYRSATGTRRKSSVLAAAIGAVTLGAAGQAPAQPEPPHFEATVLERVEPRNGFRDYGYRVWSMADDGTVYGSVYDQRGHTKAIKSKFGEGTTWLLPRDPGQIELRPIAASVSGVVLLFAFSWPQNYIYVPGHGGRQLNNLHPDLFFPYDMNNEHTLVGQVAPQPNNRAVTYRHDSGFDFLHDPESAALAVNDAGSVVGHLDSGFGWITIRIWHANGGVTTFKLPRSTTTPIGSVTINGRDEVVGIHRREDSQNDSRWGGWFWSERSGLVEIPFLREDTSEDASIYGIDDNGWVLGKEEIDHEPQWYLWHVDAGFFNLGDLYEWQGRFPRPGDFTGPAAVNAVGQIAIPNRIIDTGRDVVVFLNPVK